MNERANHLKRVISITYGEDRFGYGLYGVSLWRFKCKGWPKFCPHLSFEVGLGLSISFWHNCWCEGASLRDLFPSLYAFVANNDANVWLLTAYCKHVCLVFEMPQSTMPPL